MIDEADVPTPIDAAAKSEAATPRKRTPAEAAAHMLDARKGNILPEGVTIRAMQEEGRA